MMLTLRDAALAMQGELTAEGQIVFDRVTTDSRDVRPGDLFVALKGERFDGNDYVEQVLAAGAVAAVTSVAGKGARIVVKDTLLALQSLAAFWRQRFPCAQLIGVTGSNGKTTVKEMLASILAQHVGAEYVHATKGNLNNHIGLPLTVLGVKSDCRYVIAEMGMNHAGEIATLTRIARPDVAIINNAGQAHLEHLGSVEGVALAKGEIFEGLTTRGYAVINSDDAYAELWAKLAAGFNQTTFGLQAADVTARHIEQHATGSRFILSTALEDVSVELAVPGMHNICNALAAAAATFAIKVPLTTIADGLEAYQGVKGRLQCKQASNGALLIDDTYNANPDSMRAAVDVLVAREGKRILVLGDMGEVGSDAPVRHRELGEYAKAQGITQVFGMGEHCAQAMQAAGGQHFSDLSSLIAAVRQAMSADAVVLVKGSRFMQMERVVDALQEGA